MDILIQYIGPSVAPSQRVTSSSIKPSIGMEDLPELCQVNSELVTERSHGPT